jgi:hypothetical protein
MVSGAIRMTEYWAALFTNMSDRELCGEYQLARTEVQWHEKDRETGKDKSDMLAHEMALRFFKYHDRGSM